MATFGPPVKKIFSSISEQHKVRTLSLEIYLKAKVFPVCQSSICIDTYWLIPIDIIKDFFLENFTWLIPSQCPVSINLTKRHLNGFQIWI